MICEGKYDEKTIEINCYNCPLIKDIPVLPNLTHLDCSGCPLVKEIPVLPNLKHLYCYNCPLLQSVPPLPRLIYLDCSGCPWLNHRDNPEYKDNIEKLVQLQRVAKKTLIYRRFINYIYSRSFTEWFFHPDGPGGKIHMKQIEKFYNSISSTLSTK